MPHRSLPVSLLAALAVACAPSFDLNQATLAALRAVLLDSLTFGACTSIELDPSVRTVASIANLRPEAPTVVTLRFSADSLRTHLPLTFRSWRPSDPPSAAAQVVVGLLDRPDTARSDAVLFVIAIVGCRLGGSFAYVAVWPSGGHYEARVRAIQEG